MMFHDQITLKLADSLEQLSNSNLTLSFLMFQTPNISASEKYYVWYMASLMEPSKKIDVEILIKGAITEICIWSFALIFCCVRYKIKAKKCSSRWVLC